MGNFVIVIHGTGAHDNTDYPKDANRMAATFVQKLKQAGHYISGATFCSGGEQNLEAPWRQDIDAELPSDEVQNKVADCATGKLYPEG